MIRARQSSDPWARFAARILDRARMGGAVSADRIRWALAYVGDTDGPTKIPAYIQGNAMRKVAA